MKGWQAVKNVIKVKNKVVQVEVPGSKSLTQRALMAAALAEGLSFIRHPLVAEDTRYMMSALRELGAIIEPVDGGFSVTGTGGAIAAGGRSPRKQPCYVSPKSGETMAFGGLWEAWKSPAGEIVRVWVQTEFLGGRHERRVNKIMALEQGK